MSSNVLSNDSASGSRETAPDQNPFTSPANKHIFDKVMATIDNEELANTFSDFVERLSQAAAISGHTQPSKQKTAPDGKKVPNFHPSFQEEVDRINAAAEKESAAGKEATTLTYSILPIDPTSAPSNAAIEKGTRIFSTQPQSGHFLEFIDGQTECIFLSMHDKALFINAPGYPQPVPRPRSWGGFEIREVEGMGLGMIATRDFKFGEMIASERPLIISIAAVMGKAKVGSRAPKTFSEASDKRTVRQGMDFEEQAIETAFNRMTPRAKLQYMALHDCHSDEGMSGPLHGRLRTNGYGVQFVNGAPERKVPYTAVFNNLSRINHSCSPNTLTTWDPASISRQCYALRHIAKGEEITTSYFALPDTYAERKNTLKGYRITCKCKACASPKSFLTKLNAVQNNVPAILKWCSNPSLPGDLLLKPTLQLLELVESEGQEAHPAYGKILHHLACIYMALGDEAECEKWMEKRVILDAMYGDETPDLQTDIDLVRATTKRAGRGKKSSTC